MTRLLAIINPRAGREVMQREVRATLVKLHAEGVITQLEMIETEAEGDAEQIAHQSTTGDFQPELILAVGGDGTVHEVLNGMLHSGSRAALAILAAGTVNDFAWFTGQPTDVRGLGELLQVGRPRTIDVGLTRGRYFLNVCAGGLLTDVAYRTPSESKTTFGRLAYALNALSDLPQRIVQPLSLTIEGNEVSLRGLFDLFLVCNTSSVGGFRHIAPDARIEDGLLDVIAIRNNNPTRLSDLAGIAFQLTAGDHLQHRQVEYFQTTSVEIRPADGQDPVVLDLDGEEGPLAPVRIEVVPRALQLLMLPDARWPSQG